MANKCDILKTCECDPPCFEPLTEEEIAEVWLAADRAFYNATRHQPAMVLSGIYFR